MEENYHYPGDELAFFAQAANWKNYITEKIAPYINGDVLEVGAGIGATTKTLNKGRARSWTMLEPDEQMASALRQNIEQFPSNSVCTQGTIYDVQGRTFDTILYIDVLEHIENDQKELSEAARLLNDGGKLIVFSPAFQFLYSPFDKAIGHYQRYEKASLKKIVPENMQQLSLTYMDTAGFFASAMNKIFLRQSYPTLKQVLFWDRYLVPVSKISDIIFLHSFGKSILGVWQKQP